MLCPMISGLDAATISIKSALASKSGIRSSIVASQFSLRIASTTAAQCRAPPSGRSSRVTDVTTTCRSPINRTLSANFSGSEASGARGMPVFVAQNRHPRVQISPRIINVAVRLLQHSALFGHLPLLQIVWRECSRTMRATSAKVSLLWSLIFNHSGFLAGAFSPYNFGILF